MSDLNINVHFNFLQERILGKGFNLVRFYLYAEPDEKPTTFDQEKPSAGTPPARMRAPRFPAPSSTLSAAPARWGSSLSGMAAPLLGLN